MPDKTALKRYLSRHSTFEKVNIPCQYQSVAILPAYAESSERLLSIMSAFEHRSVLFILVINCPPADNDNNEKVLATRSCLQTLRSQLPIVCRLSDSASLHKTSPSSKCHALVIDRCSPSAEIPEKYGVGLARRIASDCACSLIGDNKIQSNWIHSIDADVVLPPDYFDLPAERKISAYLYPFEHYGSEPTITIATLIYELRLRYYVTGLKWAHSPYAFHTIGSCIAFNSESYAKVHGFPLRSGGEDFYLLNKLAKVGTVETLSSPVIRIISRDSSRVPFGTGPAVAAILEMQDPWNDYQTYNPELFSFLRTWLSCTELLWENRDLLLSQPDASIWPSVIGLDAPVIINSLEKLKFSPALKKLLSQSKTEAHFLKSFHDWFDAFRTLRFLHIIREQGYDDTPLNNSLSAHHLQLCPSNPAIEEAQLFEQTCQRLFQKMQAPLN